MSYVSGIEYGMELVLGKWKITVYPDTNVFPGIEPFSVYLKHNETTEEAVRRAYQLAFYNRG